MHTIANVIIVLGAATALAAAYYFVRAAGEARSSEPGAMLRILVRGVFATKSHFSAKGWRLRQRAMLLIAVTVLWVVAFLLAELAKPT
jgi:hypothetical protein